MTETTEMIKAIANDSKRRIDRIVANYEQLEKENAELKDYRLTTLAEQQTEMSKYALNLEHKLSWYDDQLTNAKETIKKLLDAYKYVIRYEEYADREIVKEAEQFLNSEVEK